MLKVLIDRDRAIVEKLNIWTRAPRLDSWRKIVKKMKEPKSSTTIGIVGKYVDLEDSYKSLNEALYHGGFANDVRVNLKFVDSEQIESLDQLFPAEKLLLFSLSRRPAQEGQKVE